MLNAVGYRNAGEIATPASVFAAGGAWQTALPVRQAQLALEKKIHRWMDPYFDAHLYVANWGTRRLLLLRRLPARSFPFLRRKRVARSSAHT